MLVYGAQDHKLKTHIEVGSYNTPECVSSVAEIMKYARFSSGSFKFLPRDLLTLEQNGFSLTQDGNIMKCGATPPFTDIHELTCDYYIGKPVPQFRPLREDKTRFIKTLVPTHVKTLSSDEDIDQTGEVDLPVATHALLPGMEILLETNQKNAPSILGRVKTIFPGCRLHGGAHKSSHTVGLIVLELEGNTGKYGPLCYLKPVESKAKRQKREEKKQKEKEEEEESS